jgi:hypothetical protein
MEGIAKHVLALAHLCSLIIQIGPCVFDAHRSMYRFLRQPLKSTAAVSVIRQVVTPGASRVVNQVSHPRACTLA